MKRRSSKIEGFSRVAKKDRNEVIFDLLYAFSNCKTIEESAIFIEDLLTRSELEFISRRLRIAKLLLDGYTYLEIKEILHVSDTTISKISVWLEEKGDGFRNTVKALSQKKELKDPLKNSSWTYLKKKYPVYFLPEQIIEQIVTMANQKQKKRLLEVVESLDESLKQKSQLHQSIERILKK